MGQITILVRKWSPGRHRDEAMGYEVSYWGGAPIPNTWSCLTRLPVRWTNTCRCRPLRARGPISGDGWMMDSSLKSAGNMIYVRQFRHRGCYSRYPKEGAVAYGPFFSMPLSSSQPYIAVQAGGIRLVSAKTSNGAKPSGYRRLQRLPARCQ